MDGYTDLVDKYRFDSEWNFVGRGQNGSVYHKGDVTVKITTDEVELEHAEKAEGKSFPSLNPVSNVKIHSPNLGTYEAPYLSPVPSQVKDAINKYAREITEYIEVKDDSHLQGLPPLLQKVFQQVRRDLQKAGIPLDETDIQGDNVMVDSKGKLKLIDY